MKQQKHKYPMDLKELARRQLDETPEHSCSYVRMSNRVENNARTSKTMGKEFSWTGINTAGFKITGKITAHNKSSAESILHQKKITPLSIKRQWHLPLLSKNKTIQSGDVTAFSVEFSTLISAGIPLLQALHILKESTQKYALQNMIAEISAQIEQGCLLSVALQSYAHYFGPLFCHLVHVGENAGMLDIVLKHLANYREKINTLKKKIKKALFYPCVVLIVALGVTTAMLIFVLPQFEQLFQNVGAELPLLTRIVLHLAMILRQHISLLFCIPLLLFFCLKAGLDYFPTLKNFFDRCSLHGPIIGKILQEAIFARCFRTLSMTLSAGLPLLDALQLTANVTGNAQYNHALALISQHVKNGQPLSQAFKNTRLFSNRAVQMIYIGEESGRLDEMLQKLSDYFEGQVDSKIENLTQLLEPALMIFLSCIIGTLVIAMYLPIFRLGAVL